MHVLMAIALAIGLSVQTGKDPLLSRLEGQWTGSGTVLNQPAKIEMEWACRSSRNYAEFDVKVPDP
jgi:hypothetical protein